MIARISTILPVPKSRFRKEISQPKSLQYVSKPVLTFIPEDPEIFQKPWKINRDYHLRLYLFHVIPLGRHSIRLVEFDMEKNIIKSEEKGTLAPVWNHTITFHSAGKESIRYTDVIEIKAGLLTPFVWAFAHCFYRHRQKRWKKLLM